MGGAMTEYQAISRAQYIDLVYSQSDTLYDLIPHAPRPTYDPSKPPQDHSDGIIGSVKSTPEKPSSGQTSTSNSTTKTSAKTTSTPTKNFNINVVQIAQRNNTSPSKGKKNKKKINPPEHDNEQTQEELTVDNKEKRKI